MKSVELTEKQQKDLAFKAFLLRQGIALDSEQAQEVKIEDEVLENILETQRAEDAGNDLWVTFNRVQEAITQGGFQGALQGAKIRKVRKIKSFEKDLKLNQQLFDLALQYV
jgi:heme oxygenase